TTVKYPTSPPTEFTKMNSAETAAAWRMRAHSQNKRSGVRKIPPPVPVRPARRPSPAPTPIAVGFDGGFVSSGSLRRKTNGAAEKSRKSQKKILRTEADGGM